MFRVRVRVAVVRLWLRIGLRLGLCLVTVRVRVMHCVWVGGCLLCCVESKDTTPDLLTFSILCPIETVFWGCFCVRSKLSCGGYFLSPIETVFLGCCFLCPIETDL
jgi:hypothetical protein